MRKISIKNGKKAAFRSFLLAYLILFPDLKCHFATQTLDLKWNIFSIEGIKNLKLLT